MIRVCVCLCDFLLTQNGASCPISHFANSGIVCCLNYYYPYNSFRSLRVVHPKFGGSVRILSIIIIIAFVCSTILIQIDFFVVAFVLNILLKLPKHKMGVELIGYTRK